MQVHSEDMSLLGNLKKVFNLAISKRMRTLMPELVWTGISIAFYSGVLVGMMSLQLSQQNNYSSSDQFYYSMLAMSAFGFGEVFGCFFIGWVIDKFGSKNGTISILAILILTAIMTLAYIGIWEFNMIAYSMCFLWGF